VQNRTLSGEKEVIRSWEKRDLLVFLGVLVITAWVFSGSLKLDWTNWDDGLHVYENQLVREAKFKDIFLPDRLPDYNTYIPLVISSFVLEWKLVGDRPFLYHLNNVFLHLLCTALVLVLFRKSGLSIGWSGFAALLFGIHPMRVESVAWITERKDLLYALFYLLALLSYIQYIVRGKNIRLALTFLFFALSLLSKIQAVALPLSLVLLDWYFKRKPDLKSLVEKAAFFGFSLAAGLAALAFFPQNASVSADSTSLLHAGGIFEQLATGGYAYTVYLIKSILPFATSTLYPMPSSLQPEHWLGAATAVVVFFGALACRRRFRFVTFGVLFFTFNIVFLLLSFLMNETAFLNDRYVYIAYAGLFFITAMGMQQWTEKRPAFRVPVFVLAFVMLSVMGLLTVRYIPVWKNSETLWTYVVEKYPRRIAIAYLNRGHHRHQNNQPEKALADFNTAIEVKPEYAIAYLNRSFLYLEINEPEKALADFNRYLTLIHPYDKKGHLLNWQLSEAIGYRGFIYYKTGRYQDALADFKTAIELDPFNAGHYLNRALTYMQLRRYAEAIRDLNACHHSDPGNSDIIHNRGVCYLLSGHLNAALSDFNTVIGMDDGNPAYYLERAGVYYRLGRLPEAIRDARVAEEKGAVIGPELEKLLQNKKDKK